jgi:predicted nucleic acid-binding protein
LIKVVDVVKECRDPKDDKILELSLSGKADLIRVYRLNHADLALTYPEAFAEQRFQPKICSC